MYTPAGSLKKMIDNGIDKIWDEIDQACFFYINIDFSPASLNKNSWFTDTDKTKKLYLYWCIPAPGTCSFT